MIRSQSPPGSCRSSPTTGGAPFFTVNGVRGSGSFRVGQGDYRAGNGGFKKAGDPVLEVELNGAKALYLAPGYQRRKWNHIAIVRGNSIVGPTLRLFLNGKKLQAFTRVNVGTKENPVYVFNPALDISVSLQAGSPGRPALCAWAATTRRNSMA